MESQDNCIERSAVEALDMTGRLPSRADGEASRAPLVVKLCIVWVVVVVTPDGGVISGRVDSVAEGERRKVESRSLVVRALEKLIWSRCSKSERDHRMTS